MEAAQIGGCSEPIVGGLPERGDRKWKHQQGNPSRGHPRKCWGQLMDGVGPCS